MRSVHAAQAILGCGIGILLMLGLTSCGGGRNDAANALTNPTYAPRPGPLPSSQTLAEALAEIEAAAAPAGVDVALFARLKTALATALRESGADKLMAGPPSARPLTAGN